jgi:LysM repeat protein
MKRFLLASLTFCIALTATAQTKNQAYLDYIEQYKAIAIKQQTKHRIPAAITIAQGLLESGAGKSELSSKANNHFGIKCTSDWEGRTIRYKNDCYRRYASAEDSYEDHSQFLLRKRYASLFDLSINDYKGWAKGLKQCGYAEDPKYPQKLIELIELYELQNLTKSGGGKNASKKSDDEDLAINEEEIYRQAHKVLQAYVMPPIADFHILGGHAAGYRNSVKYVIALQGDTYASISKDLDMREKALRKFNDAKFARDIQAGDMVYIYAKRNKSGRKYTYYYTQPGDNLWEISQKYGIKLKKLCKRNDLRPKDNTTLPERLQLR